MASAVLLEVKGLKAKVAATGQEILKGVDLVVREGEVRAASLSAMFAEVLDTGSALVQTSWSCRSGVCSPWLLISCVSYHV